MPEDSPGVGNPEPIDPPLYEPEPPEPVDPNIEPPIVTDPPDLGVPDAEGSARAHAGEHE